MPACCCTATEMAEAVLRKCSVRMLRLSVLLTDPINLNFSAVWDGWMDVACTLNVRYM